MPRKKEVVGGTFVKYDAVVLGSGPAGEGAAMKLAKSESVLRLWMYVSSSVVTVPTWGPFQVKLYVKRYRVLSVIAATQCLKKWVTGVSLQ